MSVSNGTCKPQSQYLCKIFYDNPNLTVQELAAKLQAAQHKLIELRVKEFYLNNVGKLYQQRPITASSLQSPGDVVAAAFYGDEFHNLCYSDGYTADSLDLYAFASQMYAQERITVLNELREIRASLGLSESNESFENEIPLKNAICSFIQLIEDFCHTNPHVHTFLGSAEPFHAVCLLRHGDQFIYYNSDLATMFYGPLDEVVSQMIFDNFNQQIAGIDLQKEITDTRRSDSCIRSIKNAGIKLSLFPIMKNRFEIINYPALPYTEQQIQTADAIAQIVETQYNMIVKDMQTLLDRAKSSTNKLDRPLLFSRQIFCPYYTAPAASNTSYASTAIGAIAILAAGLLLWRFKACKPAAIISAGTEMLTNGPYNCETSNIIFHKPPHDCAFAFS